MARVADSIRIPIATGERLTTKNEFSQVLQEGAASILQPALGRSGGILETKKIAAIAEVYNAHIAPHLYAGPVEWAANIQLAVNIPNILMVETILTGSGFSGDLIKNKIQWDDGYIIAPTSAGLGIEFDEDIARNNKYIENRLHLEMQDAPCDYKNGNAFSGGASD